MLESADRVQIGIRLQTPPHMPPSLVNAVIGEIERLWNFPAVKLNWHQSSRQCASADNRLLIVHFVGECSMVRAEPAFSSATLGHTHVSDNKVLPFIDVNCSAVAASVSSRQREGTFLRQDRYARALAAVLTHEMVHALTASRRHETAGVMQPSLSPRDLDEKETVLTPNVIENLGEALHVTLTEERHR